MFSESFPVGGPVQGGGSAPTPPVIEAHGLSKCYHVYDRPQDRLKQAVVPRLQSVLRRPRSSFCREFWALRDVSFTIGQRETVGIIGRNGSGKSTLLQIICGTLHPTAGVVSTRGRVAALLELGSGFNPEFSGRENVYLNAAVLGLDREQVDQRFEAIECFAGIGAFIDQPVKTYSSGMFVRLAFAVVAHVDADILVVDEALAVGDVFFTQKCMRFLRGFQERGTVLFVSHDASAVTALCDRAIWLDQGSIVMQGEAKEVCEAYHENAYARAGQPMTIRPRGRAAEVPMPQPEAEAAPSPPAVPDEIRAFTFDPDAAGFGDGRARIEHVELRVGGSNLAWISGGEGVVLRIEAAVHDALASPIIGFMVKDRLGQHLFGDNTHLTYADCPVPARAGERLAAEFVFEMPILPPGQYTVDVAIADGTPERHVQADWVRDALVVESYSKRVSTGLVGIPMRAIRLGIDPRGEVEGEVACT